MARWFSKEPLVGLDLGRHTVRAVWVIRTGATVRLQRQESLLVPAEQGMAREALQAWVDRVGLRGASCAVALPGSQTLFQPLNLAPEDPRADAQAAAVEVVRYSEMVSEVMRFAHARFSLGEGDRRLLLAMARAEAVEEALARVVELGVRPVEMVPSAVALYNALAPQLDERPALLVNVGATATDVAVGTSRGLAFARSFAVGGRSFTDAWARHGRMAFAAAESRKTSEGALREDHPAWPVLRPVADQWLNELRACLAIHQNLFPEPVARPVRLIMVGGGARLPGFTEWVAGSLGMPLAAESGETLRLADGLEGDWAVAWGSALVAAGAACCGISLLPERWVQEREFRRQKPVWTAAAVTAVMVFLVGWVGGYRDLRKKSAFLTSQKASLQLRQELAQSIEEARERNEQLRAMAETVRRLMDGSRILEELLEALAAGRDPNDWVTVIADADSYFAKSGTEPAGAGRAATPGYGSPPVSGDQEQPPPSPFGRLLIEGYTRRGNLITVKRLIDALQGHPRIALADLLSDDERSATEAVEIEGLGSVRRFILDVRLRDR